MITVSNSDECSSCFQIMGTRQCHDTRKSKGKTTYITNAGTRQCHRGARKDRKGDFSRARGEPQNRETKATKAKTPLKKITTPTSSTALRLFHILILNITWTYGWCCCAGQHQKKGHSSTQEATWQHTCAQIPRFHTRNARRSTRRLPNEGTAQGYF